MLVAAARTAVVVTAPVISVKDLKKWYTLYDIPTWRQEYKRANNVTTINNNITTDNVQSYHLKKLQEVGYRSMQIVNSTEREIKSYKSTDKRTIATVPAKVVEMAYSTSPAPNEIRTGYFISTATNATAPNLGTTKGYAVFYEGNSSTRTCCSNTNNIGIWQFSTNIIIASSRAGI